MKITDLERWRVEIMLAERYRKDNFGEYTPRIHEKVGRNIDYFERGISNLMRVGQQSMMGDEEIVTTLNIIHTIVKNIVPAVAYKNPHVMVTPRKISAQDTAPIVENTMNYYYQELEVEFTHKDVVWDAYVLGHGYSKVGYVTKFGKDIGDGEKKKKNVVDRTLEKLGLQKEEKEIVRPEMDYEIISENPYISYVSPFMFLRDPRSNTIEESMWVGEQFKKSVKSMKSNKKMKNTDKLEGSLPEVEDVSLQGVSAAEVEDFKFIDLYFIQYRSGNDTYDLIISKDNEEWREHYHAKSIYEMDGWQYGELSFNKHRHKSFAVSDISKIVLLQDRMTSTIDAILRQVDTFVPKIAIDGGKVTEDGKEALETGDIGAIVECAGNPREAIQEIGLTQLKADLKVLLEEFISLVSIITGLTKAQILGVAQGETATSETIAQGGYTLRLQDMNKAYDFYAKKEAKKLWQVIKQFVDLESLELINGQSGVDENGIPQYNWLTVDDAQSEMMQLGQYDFQIELGSSQKAELSVVRKQFENLFSILSRTDVITLMQQQGDKVVLSELLRMYIKLFPEAIRDVGRIIQKITPQTQGLVPEEAPGGPGGTTTGSNFNALEGQVNQPLPTAGGQI